MKRGGWQNHGRNHRKADISRKKDEERRDDMGSLRGLRKNPKNEEKDRIQRESIRDRGKE